MADWKDFVEDNRERAGQFLDAVRDRTRSQTSQISLLPLLRCPVCVSVFSADEALQKHITGVHGPQHVYLRVNGNVIRDVAWAEHGIRTASVILLGHAGAHVAVRTGTAASQTLVATSDQSLTNCWPRDFEGEIHIDVVPHDGKQRSFLLYSRTLPDFRQDELDRQLWKLLQEFCGQPVFPDLKTWHSLRQGAASSSELGQRYINGFFEYAAGFALERRGDTGAAKEHLEDAFGYLLPFRTLLAEQALCVLGLKMNCFGILERCEPTSPFAPAQAFFAQNATHWEPHRPSPNRDSLGVYIDEFTCRLLHVVRAFYESDHTAFWQGIAALQFHPAGREKNNVDKLQLLQARACARNGDRARAKDCYALLRYDPQFGAEAEEFLTT
jgi:hypothetical protein